MKESGKQFRVPFLVPAEASRFLFYIHWHTVPCPTLNARPRVTRFRNCSSVNNCNFHLMSYMDLRGAGVSSLFRGEHSRAGLLAAGGLAVSPGKPDSRLTGEALAPSAGSLLQLRTRPTRKQHIPAVKSGLDPSCALFFRGTEKPARPLPAIKFSCYHA